MKPASASTISIIGAGKYERLHLFQFALAGGAVSYYFTSHQVPVVYNGIAWANGLVVNLPDFKWKVGLEVQSAAFEFIPQTDGGKQVIVAGQTFLKAAAAKVFDGARLLYRRMYLNSFTDFSPGDVPWWQGRVNDVAVDRVKAVFTINSDVEMLGVNMPPNLVQTSCGHTLFDSGCTLKAANFTITGTVTSGSDVLDINFAGTQPTDYFTLGKIVFTSGANATNPRTTYFIKKHTQSGGTNTLQLIRPLPNTPTVGDTFSVTAGCPKTWNACKNTDSTVGPAFNNSVNFDGMPFVPVPETLYDGGTPKIYNANAGGQTGAPIGSPFGSGSGPRGSYKP